MLTDAPPPLPHDGPTPLAVIVLAKAAVPGRVKTRLTVADPLAPSLPVFTPSQAADIHHAMLRCVLERVDAHLPRCVKILALDDIAAFRATVDIASSTPPHDGWALVTQPPGSLGDRLAHAWQNALRDHPRHAVMFLGVDCPDVPGEALQQIPRRLPGAGLLPGAGVDALVGRVSDGGYWTLVAGRFSAALLQGIDWGTASVYDQTHAAARSAGLRLLDLPPWHDVDSPGDVAALLRRLGDHVARHPKGSTGHDTALATLREALRHIVPVRADRDKTRR